MEAILVINGNYGGFSLNREMAEWLRDNKGWKLAPSDTYPTDDFDLAGDNDFWYASTKWNRNEIEFRSNPDLIECVRWLKWKYRNYDKHSTRYIEDHRKASSIRHAYDLRIVKVNIEIGIADKFDGIEAVHVHHHEETEENPKSTDDLIREAQWIIRDYGKSSPQMREFRKKYADYPDVDDVAKMASDLLSEEKP